MSDKNTTSNRILGLFRDEYDRKARLYPGLLVALPYFVLVALCLRAGIREIGFVFAGLRMLAVDAVAGCAVAWAAVAVVRALGKWLEGWMFADGLNMPTTEMLMWGDGYLSTEMKRRVHSKIQDDFGINLFSRTREASNGDEARKTIRDAMKLVRDSVGNGRIVLQYNIYYGFWRNLAASAWIGTIGFAALGLLESRAERDCRCAAIYGGIAVAYALLSFFDRKIIAFHGRRYAETLLGEYLSLSPMAHQRSS